jgi:hypothetical protein
MKYTDDILTLGSAGCQPVDGIGTQGSALCSVI